MKTTARIPLLKDHHTHPCLYAALATSLDLGTISDKTEALCLIRQRFATEDFVIVTGWYDSSYVFDADEIDCFPPLILFNVSFHAVLMNAAAREKLSPSFPHVVNNHRDRRWVERNAALVLNFFLEVQPCGAASLRSFYAGLARLGIWYAEEMSLKGEEELAGFRGAALLERARFWTGLENFETLGNDARNCVHGIKLFADGAVGARTAMLDVPYRGGEEGILIWHDRQLRDRILAASRTGKALSIHAIGNVAIDQAVRVLERLPAATRKKFPEIRLEHCQFISRSTADAARSMDIKLGVQPNFSLDSLCYRDRLPEAYQLRNNPLRMLIDDVGYQPGRDLLFGSDGMPHGARAALESALFPPVAGQQLTLDEFVAGYCMPDFTHGFIDISLEKEQKSVEIEVVLDEKESVEARRK